MTQNQFYSEEAWEKVNPVNKQFRKDFLTSCKFVKSEGTIRQYANNSRIFLIYVLKELDNIDIRQLKRKDFLNFRVWLSEQCELSNARVNSLISCTRSLLENILDDEENEYDINPSKKIKGLPKKPIRTDEDDFFLEFEDIMKIRKILIDRDQLLEATLFMFLFDTGARRNEVHQLTKHFLQSGCKTESVIGKGGKTFRLIIMPDTRELALRYLEQRGDDDIDSLWVIGTGNVKREINYNAIYLMFVHEIRPVAREVLNKKVNIFPHTMRHSRAESLIKGTDNRLKDKDGKNVKLTLEQVRKFLHHESTDTTNSYLKQDDSELDEIFGI